METKEQNIQESGEMYLETILRLKQNKPTVLSVDIVEDLNYSKSSVSRGVNILKERGYIKISHDGAIEFTESGLLKAKEIYERHTILTKYLIRLGVNKETAEIDACRMEHVISEETFNIIKKHGEKKV